MKIASSLEISPNAALFFGIMGILGSLTLFTGDMLFYYRGSEMDFIANMAQASDSSITLSAISALFAAWFYTIAAGQMYYAFQPAEKWLQLSIFLSFLAIMIAYGIVHAAYVAIAISAKNASALGVSPHSLVELAVTVNHTLRDIVYVPFALFTLLFTFAVVQKKSYFPRWILIPSPIVLFVLSEFLINLLTGEIKAIVSGGYLNLLLLVFFSCTTFALWRKSHDV